MWILLNNFSIPKYLLIYIVIYTYLLDIVVLFASINNQSLLNSISYWATLINNATTLYDLEFILKSINNKKR